MCNELYPGDRVMVFDSLLFVDDRKTPLTHTVRPATIVCRYGRKSNIGPWVYEDLVDVVFDHRPDKISKGHFTDCVRVLEYLHKD